MFVETRRRLGVVGTALAVTAMGLVPAMFLPALAGATETPTEEKVKEVAKGVGTEGVEIVLIILTALIGLLVAIIVIPKAIGLIRRFI